MLATTSSGYNHGLERGRGARVTAAPRALPGPASVRVCECLMAPVVVTGYGASNGAVGGPSTSAVGESWPTVLLVGSAVVAVVLAAVASSRMARLLWMVLGRASWLGCRGGCWCCLVLG